MDDEAGTWPDEDGDDERGEAAPTEGIRITGAQSAGEAVGQPASDAAEPTGSPRDDVSGDPGSGDGGGADADGEGAAPLPGREAIDPNQFGAVPIITPDSPPPPGLDDATEAEAPPDPEPVSSEPTPTSTDEAPEFPEPRLPAAAAQVEADPDLVEPSRPAAPVEPEPEFAEPPLPPAPADSDPAAAPAPEPDLGGPSTEAVPTVATEPELPHWTEPGTGEVPAVAAATGDGDELEPWTGLGSSEPQWRGQSGDGPPDDFSDLAGGDTTVAPRSDSPAPAPAAAFDDLRQDPPPIAAAAGPPQRRADPYPDEVAPHAADSGDGGGRDMRAATLTGVAFGTIALVALAVAPAAAVVVVVGLVVMMTAEFFNATRQAGYHPAALVGLAGSVALPLAVYWRGEAAFPLVTFLIIVTAMSWWLLELGGERAVVNISITVFGALYIGGLASFATLILKFPVNGTGLLIGAIVATVAYDVGGLVIGSRMGSSPISPASPNKTVEGLIGGGVTAVIASVVVLGVIGVHPWEVSDALILGLAVAVAAPLGDLCESLIKRDLGLKDMSSMLPGHGGFLDRFDALLFVLPATYYVVRLLDTFANT